jgi:hypothetical protein
MFHHSARHFAASVHDFLVKQKIIKGFLCEYLAMTSGSLLTVNTSSKDAGTFYTHFLVKMASNPYAFAVD